MLGKLVSNADAAENKLFKMMTSERGQIYFGNVEYSQKMGKQMKDEWNSGKKMKAIGTFGKTVIDNYTGADFKGQGSKRAKAVAVRAGVDIGSGVLLEGGMRYAKEEGTFTEKDGKRDIAGIPFI